MDKYGLNLGGAGVEDDEAQCHDEMLVIFIAQSSADLPVASISLVKRIDIKVAIFVVR